MRSLLVSIVATGNAAEGYGSEEPDLNGAELSFQLPSARRLPQCATFVHIPGFLFLFFEPETKHSVRSAQEGSGAEPP